MHRLLVVAFFLCSATASAIPVEWSLNNIQLLNPGLSFSEMSGSFVYDADINSIDSANLVINQFSGIQLSYGIDAYGDGASIYFTETAVASIVELENYSGYAMLFQLDSTLTNAGGNTTLVDGEIPLSPSEPLTAGRFGDCTLGLNSCFISGVYTSVYDVATYDGGTIVGVVTAVPVPAAVWLFASALAGLGWLRKKYTL